MPLRAVLKRSAIASTGTPDRDFVASVTKLAGSSVAGQLLPLLVAPVLTRLYSPFAFGVFGTLTVFLGTVGVAACLRFDAAIVGARTRRDASHLLALAICSAMAVSCCAGLLMLILIEAQLFGFEHVPRWGTLIVIPGLMIYGSASGLRFWLTRLGSFRAIGQAVVLRGVVRAAIQLLAVGLTAGWLGLLAGELAGRLAAVARMASAGSQRLTAGLRVVRLRYAISTFGRYREFPLISAPSAFVDTLATLLPLPLVAHFYGIEMAGLFAIVQRFVMAPVGLVIASVADVFHNRAGEIFRQRPAQLSALLARTARWLLVLGLAPALLGAALSRSLFVVVFGPEWAVAGTLAAVMVPWILAQLVVSPLTRIVFVAGGQHSKLIYDVVALAVTLVAMVGGHASGLSLVQSIAVLSGLHTATYLVYYLVLKRIAARAPLAEAG